MIKILRIHGINGNNPSIPNFVIHSKIENFVTKLPFNKATFVTKTVCAEWKDKYGEFTCDMIPILNGYNQNLFKPSDSWVRIDKKYDIVTFSGISENKGQIRVVQALCKLRKQGIKFSYLIIGNGKDDYLRMVKKLVSDNKLNVSFRNYLSQKEICNVLYRSKFFILPSITEGFGKVFIESLGTGIPVILPKHLPLANEPGVLNNQNAIFLEDSKVESIERKLKELYDNPIVFDPVKVSKSISHLSWSKIAVQYIDVYKSLI